VAGNRQVVNPLESMVISAKMPRGACVEAQEGELAARSNCTWSLLVAE